MDTIIASLVSGIVAIVVCILNSRSQAKDFAHALEVQQAVTNTKLDELTREVREHNHFASRIPVIEEKVKRLEEERDDGR